MQELTLKFDNIAGKKMSPDQAKAMESGYREAYREPIPGGFRLTFAKSLVAMKGSSKVTVLLLDDMPPKEVLNADFGLHDAVLTRPARKDSPKQEYAGKYGLCDGRKFLVQSNGGNGHSEPSDQQKRTTTRSKPRLS